MTNKELADEITDFFNDHDMLGGATYNEMKVATHNAIRDNDLDILLDYFKDIKYYSTRADNIYYELKSRKGD